MGAEEVILVAEAIKKKLTVGDFGGICGNLALDVSEDVWFEPSLIDCNTAELQEENTDLLGLTREDLRVFLTSIPTTSDLNLQTE